MIFRDLKVTLPALVVLVVLLVLDLGSKEWAIERLSAARQGPAPAVCEGPPSRARMQRLPDRSITIIEDYFDFSYTENCAAAFSLGTILPLKIRTLLFTSAASIASCVLLWMLVVGRGTTLFAWSIPFVVSGALGNMIDRLRHGYVVDFIHVHGPSWEYPVFNVADITISIGVALIVIDTFVAEREAKRKKEAEATREQEAK